MISAASGGLLLCCARPPQWFSDCGHITEVPMISAASGGLLLVGVCCFVALDPLSGLVVVGTLLGGSRLTAACGGLLV